MAYSVDKISNVSSYALTSEFADDGAFDVDITTCMTNGTDDENCDEIKEGTTCLKVEIAIDPATITALNIRFYVDEAKTTGNNTVVPYTDANSVSSTNGNEQAYDTNSAWVVHELTEALIAELGDVGGKCYLRLVSEGSAKTKIGEVEIEATYTTYKVEGITKDNDGNALGSCVCSIFKDETGGVYTYIDTQESNAVTGAYSFTGLDPGDYMVTAHKADTPDVMDVTDSVTAVEE